MRIDVCLGGYSTQWRMEDSLRFEAWMKKGDWANEGGFRLVRLPSLAHEITFRERLREALISSTHHLGSKCVQLQYPDLVDPKLDFESVVLRNLGVESDNSYQSLLDAAHLFEQRPIALVLVLPRSNEYAVIGECQDFIDRIEKVGGYKRPSVFAFVIGDVAPLQPAFSMKRGEPENLTLCDPDLEDRERWQRYLHQRVAWEFGGAVNVAEYWNRELSLEKLPTGNDELLENRLNHAANQLMFAADQSAVEQVVESICSYGSFDASVLEPVEDADNLYCWTEGLHRPTLCPWLARALLSQGKCPDLCDQLRAILNCRPLASELLYQCFAVEARERVRCCTSMPCGQEAPDHAIRSHREFSTNDRLSFARFYPSDFPVKQWSVWQFASFGEILSSTLVRDDRNHRDCQHRIRKLRNALSHGHYPSWQMLTEAVEVFGILR